MNLNVVGGPDNDRFAFRGRRGFRRCAKCNELTHKWEETAIEISDIGRIRVDVSSTYDGMDVVSSRFTDAYREAGLTGLSFLDLGAGFSTPRAVRRIPFDVGSRKTRLVNRCEACGSYESVTGATPVFLVPPVVVQPSEFVWTDFEFGSGDEKSPLLICGSVAAGALRKAKLKGLDLMSDVRCVARID